IGHWLSVLEITGQILLIPPFHENFGKRLVKTPKLYFADSGLACHLTGVRDEAALRDSPFLEALFEGMVASEIVKHRINRGRDRALYYFRDRQGLEVDFVVDDGNRHLTLIEAKATRTPMPGDAVALDRLAAGIKNYRCKKLLVAGAVPSGVPAGVRPGVALTDPERLHSHLA
ncbi:MAG TPA: DUF4143 domain-containing protein, partial [Kiritimatiellia bacterium]|nr:DUF4143 domain-containing protein [Kiritimatiellia bacterium]